VFRLVRVGLFCFIGLFKMGFVFYQIGPDCLWCLRRTCLQKLGLDALLGSLEVVRQGSVDLVKRRDVKNFLLF
jgi:hypothetical protein